MLNNVVKEMSNIFPLRLRLITLLLLPNIAKVAIQFQLTEES